MSDKKSSLKKLDDSSLDVVTGGTGNEITYKTDDLKVSREVKQGKKRKKNSFFKKNSY